MLLLFASALHADGTLRITATVKMGALIPPSLLQQSGKPMPTPEPIVSIIQVQGNKELAGSGQHQAIYDFSTQQVTVLDSTGKHYATVYMTDYMSQLSGALPAMPTLPPQAKAILQTVKAEFSSQKTGKTDTVLGVPVSERIWTLTFELPATGLPFPGAANSPNGTITIAKIVAHAWVANSSDVANNRTLNEVMGHRSSTATAPLNPETFLKMLSDYPGIRDPLAAIVGRYTSNPPVALKMEAEIYVPIMAQIAPLMAAQGKLPPDFNPNAALAEIDVVADQLSDAPIDPAVFQVPGDYTSMPLPQLLEATAKATAPQRHAPMVYTNQ
jgi:hypothetical protein